MLVSLLLIVAGVVGVGAVVCDVVVVVVSGAVAVLVVGVVGVPDSR